VSEPNAVCGHPSGEVMFGRCSACGTVVSGETGDRKCAGCGAAIPGALTWCDECDPYHDENGSRV